MDTEQVIKKAAEQLAEWTKRIQLCQLRLRCAEIVWSNGSANDKKNLDTEAARLYRFAIGGKLDEVESSSSKA